MADRTTTCNEFCGRCGTALGYQASGKNDGVGRFAIERKFTMLGAKASTIQKIKAARMMIKGLL